MIFHGFPCFFFILFRDFQAAGSPDWPYGQSSQLGSQAVRPASQRTRQATNRANNRPVAPHSSDPPPSAQAGTPQKHRRHSRPLCKTDLRSNFKGILRTWGVELTWGVREGGPKLMDFEFEVSATRPKHKTRTLDDPVKASILEILPMWGRAFVLLPETISYKAPTR